MNVNEVLDYINDECMPVIVCGNNIAIIKKEFEKDEDNFYLIKNKTNITLTLRVELNNISFIFFNINNLFIVKNFY